MSDEELRIFALSNMQLLIITGIEEGKYADKALEAFELIIKRKKGTPEIYEAYILIKDLDWTQKIGPARLMVIVALTSIRVDSPKRFT